MQTQAHTQATLQAQLEAQAQAPAPVPQEHGHGGPSIMELFKRMAPPSFKGERESQCVVGLVTAYQIRGQCCRGSMG
ncbi:hypothetical protein Taro_000973 [Colocasia esculenta]|uniref:Uncharacterized protein n=1 Tax=Colocasia esculenta TaxID=4460 RepID=A0A843TC94_COLES|nr:hypothetical protein [Colocasia esculenta]